jgi:hypothetical protein
MKQSKLMGIGISAAAAAQLAEAADLATAIAAAGSTQATATPIYADVNVVAAVAASTGVLLPGDRSVGDVVEVSNLGANPLAVYPPAGSAIGSGAANAALAVPVGKTGRFRLVAPLVWNSLVSA